MKFFIVMAMLLGSSVASAENKQITSPDGKLVVTVADMDGRPSYSVSYDNVLFLKPSPLGIIANIGDFSSGMSLEKNVSTNKIDETYELASIKQSKVRYVANEAVFSFMRRLIQQMMSQGKMAGEKDIHFPVYFVMEIMVGCLFPKRE